MAKRITIKGAGDNSGGFAWKAVRLIAGDLLHVLEHRLRIELFIQIVGHNSAEVIVVPHGTKA
jgi:hypothetical protein